MTVTGLSHAEMLDVLRARIEQEGGRLAAADKLSFSRSVMSNTLNGANNMSDSLAETLGYRRVSVYVKVAA